MASRYVLLCSAAARLIVIHKEQPVLNATSASTLSPVSSRQLPDPRHRQDMSRTCDCTCAAEGRRDAAEMRKSDTGPVGSCWNRHSTDRSSSRITKVQDVPKAAAQNLKHGQGSAAVAAGGPQGLPGAIIR